MIDSGDKTLYTPTKDTEVFDSRITCIPNTFREQITIQFITSKPDETILIEIYNQTGVKIDSFQEISVNTGIHMIKYDTNLFSADLFYLTITTDSYSKTKKIIKLN